MANLSCFERSADFLASLPQDHPKWVLDKTWSLNPSGSKRVTVGLRLEQKLAPGVRIEGQTGLGLSLDEEEFMQLLQSERVLMAELKQPSSETENIGAFKAVSWKVVFLQNKEPALRVWRDDKYVILGQVTCEMLFFIAPAIVHRMRHLQRVLRTCDQWIVPKLEMVRAESLKACNQGPIDESVVLFVFDFLRFKVLSYDEWRLGDELFSDMMFKHKFILAKLACDYIGVL